jgi:hypothetical protein
MEGVPLVHLSNLLDGMIAIFNPEIEDRAEFKQILVDQANEGFNSGALSGSYKTTVENVQYEMVLMKNATAVQSVVTIELP